ncbi:MAG: hypothetical protein ACJAXV_000339 [Bacteroidia bacterium]|jgi:hypothetical protein
MRTLTLMLVLFPILLIGQNISETDILKDYCEQAERLDWMNKSVNEISSELSQIALKIQQEHLTTIDQIKREIKVDKPELTDKELDVEFVTRLIESLADTCDTYVSLTRRIIKPCPIENKTLDLITNKIDSIMEQNQYLSYSEQLSLANNGIFSIIMDNESQVNKDYKDGFTDPELVDNVGIYLLHKSDRYYKAYLVSESIKKVKQ